MEIAALVIAFGSVSPMMESASRTSGTTRTPRIAKTPATMMMESTSPSTRAGILPLLPRRRMMKPKTLFCKKVVSGSSRKAIQKPMIIGVKMPAILLIAAHTEDI